MALFDSEGRQAQVEYQDIQPLLTGGPSEDAIEAIRVFLLNHPDYAIAHNDIAVLYFRQGDKLRALAHYEKASRLMPENLTFRRNLADFYFTEIGWTDDAILIYTDILSKLPTDTQTLESLGIISIAIGRSEEAKIFFKRILELTPWNNEVRDILTQLENPFSEAPVPAQNPVDTQSAELQSVLAGLRETISSLETTTASDMYRKAQALAQQGETVAAIKQLEDLLAIEPTNSLAHNDLGVLYYQQGNLRKSLEHHETAVSQNRNNSTFRKNLANLYYQELRRTDEAIQIYVDLLKEFPDDVEVLSSLSVISIANDRREEASIFLNKLLQLQPWNNEARALLEQLSDKATIH